MTRLTFKDLCLDAVDLDAMVAFWARATGLSVGQRHPETVCLSDPAQAPGGNRVVWVNKVGEAHRVKNRVHVDVHTRDIDRLVAAGAEVVDDRGWIVMRDPDGNEFCAFVRNDERADGFGVYEVVVDSADPEAEARWWAERFGVEACHDDADPWWWVCPPGAPFESIVFTPVPEPKLVKNRVHWDVVGPEGEAGRHVADDLVAVGATLLAAPSGTRRWWTLASPEGHEFCLFEHRD